MNSINSVSNYVLFELPVIDRGYVVLKCKGDKEYLDRVDTHNSHSFIWDLNKLLYECEASEVYITE